MIKLETLFLKQAALLAYYSTVRSWVVTRHQDVNADGTGTFGQVLRMTEGKKLASVYSKTKNLERCRK